MKFTDIDVEKLNLNELFLKYLCGKLNYPENICENNRY